MKVKLSYLYHFEAISWYIGSLTLICCETFQCPVDLTAFDVEKNNALINLHLQYLRSHPKKQKKFKKRHPKSYPYVYI